MKNLPFVATIMTVALFWIAGWILLPGGDRIKTLREVCAGIGGDVQVMDGYCVRTFYKSGTSTAPSGGPGTVIVVEGKQ